MVHDWSRYGDCWNGRRSFAISGEGLLFFSLLFQVSGGKRKLGGLTSQGKVEDCRNKFFSPAWTLGHSIPDRPLPGIPRPHTKGASPASLERHNDHFTIRNKSLFSMQRSVGRKREGDKDLHHKTGSKVKGRRVSR